ncbi:MAG: tRNA (N6-isopentenyl adenosine(37)-C2)-methylthiotransferase MiaB [Bacteroidota bacterium]|nr:tRNA (N6-isopentenyl adenosine(37)-C2)-methylthiotransferase MiaB [Bacteroidota bacterium]MDP4234177.1 tRNA (N6-isopentenyl adenosine(37)-C2)-methylthiotransferase MiaB [Bacteroidota bacterium]MDP4243757.1 tRNA (N6-isopentenyl adenosine(37)-C2)-methylthiotransferase MiaB [Bacteroidota bacterium]MDP4287878.1 tRNA (N6-isopentenyl adenosine(37)-C2)-methylthiotransferase MiaB [Bacteroidota bacterium]
MKKVYIETYGCQMNVADTEVVLSVLNKAGYQPTTELEGADLALMNTCAIRENAEEKVWNRLTHWKNLRKRNPEVVVGVLGCMAEHLRKDLLKNSGAIVDLVVGPDEYRKLPSLLESIRPEDATQMAVRLSRTETYDDILPFRSEGISAFISVMRGCDKFCTYCVVPYTRGRERSRSMQSIVDECKELEQQGFREITLLGQNVNSYRDQIPLQPSPNPRLEKVAELDFSDLLAACASAVPSVRIRYTTSHPQDFDQKLVDTMAEHDNICKYIHLPLQSGSDRILKLMNRTYTREHYLSIIEMIRRAMPNVALSTDLIVGFCTETLEDHEMTMQVMRDVEYDGAYTFNYSERPNTRAASTLPDDIPLEEKTRRLQEIIALQNEHATRRNLLDVGCEHTVLVEGRSKKNAGEWKGRTDTNKTVIFPRADAEVGEYRQVSITRSNSATLFGELSGRELQAAVSLDDATHRGLKPTAPNRGDVLYDLTPLVISTIERGEHSGIQQPMALQLPVMP